MKRVSQDHEGNISVDGVFLFNCQGVAYFNDKDILCEKDEESLIVHLRQCAARAKGAA